MHNLDRLRWRCRRGTLELDTMLTRYLDQSYPKASQAERRYFVTLLDLQDTELLNYFLGSQLPESEELTRLVKKIRSLPSSGD